MAILIRFLMVAVAAVSILVIVRQVFGGREPRNAKCATCSHCRKLFHDGVMCGFEQREVFKNQAQVNMCPNHEPR